MFCTNCGAPRASHDNVCRDCGAALLELPEPPSTTSTSKLVPLSRYPFLQRRQGEVAHAIKYCDAIIERKFAGDVKKYSLAKHIRGLYVPPEEITYRVPVMLVTNKRILFLENDANLLSLSVIMRSREALTNDRLDSTRRPGEAKVDRRLEPHRRVRVCLSPYWVLDPSLNDELDQEFKDCIWPRISNLDNLPAMYREDGNSPHERDEAWAEWTWVRRKGKEKLQFNLGCVYAIPPLRSAVAQVSDDAPRFVKAIARFFDKIQSGRRVSYGETEGSARIHLKTSDEIAELSSMLDKVPTAEMVFTEKYRTALRRGVNRAA